jgi:hypothetical protein
VSTRRPYHGAREGGTRRDPAANGTDSSPHAPHYERRARFLRAPCYELDAMSPSSNTAALATAETIFRAYFWPLYPPDVQTDLAAARTTDANPANNPAILAHLEDAAHVFAGRARTLFDADDADLALDFSDASVHRLSAALTRERRDRWAASAAAGSPENDLFNVIVHGAAYLGMCIVAKHGGRWAVRRPLWESLVHLKSRMGEADLAVFHWWLKSLSDDAFAQGTTLADRYRAHVENACARPEDLPVIAVKDRKLPRLHKPRYDTLYKYIKAHLPELKDLGEHFPAPERFEQLAFTWIEFTLVGDGRMLIMQGANEHGVHLFWLDASGFEKSAFYPADKFPEPVIRVVRAPDGAGGETEKIQVCVSVQSAMVVHETLWWGP